MTLVAAAGNQIVMHVHDEVVIDVHKGGASVEDITGLMSRLPI